MAAPYKRSVKGSALTATEHDENVDYFIGLHDNIVASIGTGVKAVFKTVAAFLADNNSLIGYAGSGARTIVADGDIIEAGGYRLEIDATGASDNHLVTAGGVKASALKVNNVWPMLALNPAADGATNDKAKIDLVNSSSETVDLGGKSYEYDGTFTPIAKFINGKIIDDARTDDFTTQTRIDNLAYGDARQQINFFDFIQGKTSAEREQIANGTFAGDLSTEWTAFHAALQAVADAGGYPYGLIPQCQIRHNTDLNFGMDWLRLETLGYVRILNTGSGPGIRFDGRGLGAGSFGLRRLYVGALEASSWSGTVGYDVMWCHKSTFERPSSRGGSSAGLRIRSCVTSEFRSPIVSNQIGAFINNNRPDVGIYVSAVPSGESLPGEPVGGMYCSWCTLINPVGEYASNANIQLDDTFGITILGGTAEGSGGGTNFGFVTGTNTLYAKIIGLDCEANTSYDIYHQGQECDFVGVDTQDSFILASTAIGNRIIGGKHNLVLMEASSHGNLVVGAGVATFTNNSTTTPLNRISNSLVRGASDTITGWQTNWKSYTPTVAAAAGAITTYSASGEWTQSDDNTIHFRATATITANGTGSGALDIGLPVATFGSGVVTFAGFESGVTAKAIIARANAAESTARCYFSDATYPAQDGAIITISGTYRRG